MDTLLSGVLAFLQPVLGGMGVYVALRPPIPKWHKAWIASFVTVGLVGVFLTVWLAHLADSAQERLHSEIGGMGLEEARMSGELSGIRIVMENLSKAGIPGLKEFAQSIIGSVQSGLRHGAEETKLSNQQLCDRAASVAQRIRAFQSEYDKKEEEISTREWQARIGKTPGEMSAMVQKEFAEHLDRNNRYVAEFQNQYIPDAKYIHDKIMDRLTLEQRDALVNHNGQAEISLSLARSLGAFDAYQVAAYLNSLAQTLCSKRP